MVIHTSNNGDPYIKLSYTLSGVKISTSVMSQLNILCTNPIKQYYTKNNQSPVICRYIVMANLPLFTCSPT